MIHMEKKKKKYIKNLKAKQYLGIRNSGQPLFGPHELGYVCPICGEGNEVNLHFSEYNSFLWCENCNIDIPSCLCVKNGMYENFEKELTKREQIEQAINVFFATADDIIDKFKKDYQINDENEEPRTKDSKSSKKQKK